MSSAKRTKGMIRVQGYVFEGLTRDQAKQFNYLCQMWDTKFVLVDHRWFVLIDDDGEDMRALCILLQIPYKPRVTIETSDVEDIPFNTKV